VKRCHVPVEPRVGPLGVDRAPEVGHHLGVTTAQLAPSRGPVDEALEKVASGWAPREFEIEANEGVIQLRAIPLKPKGTRIGSLVLLRDVTELRRRERELITKDATIREIHHRVKNNLQTIASLLRLQSRRLGSPEAKQALEESVRRIRSIALVHETLAYEAGNTVPFGEIIRPLVRVVEDGLVSPDRHIRFTVEGDPGDLPAEVATPLAVVLTELLQNAVEHGFPDNGSGGVREGLVTVRVAREDDDAVVDVVDNGVGLPPGFSPETASGLGLSIVRTLVQSELAGELTMKNDGGTRVHLRVPIAAPRVER